MSATNDKGERGERDVVRHVRCPNCGRPLMQLPRGYPLYDVQCEGCSFRAQVKTAYGRPRGCVFGAGWDILEKVRKAGLLIPPLLVNFKWPKDAPREQEIRFYPFIPASNIRRKELGPGARRAGYRMFDYVGLNDLPHFVVFRKGGNSASRSAREARRQHRRNSELPKVCRTAR